MATLSMQKTLFVVVLTYIYICAPRTRRHRTLVARDTLIHANKHTNAADSFKSARCATERAGQHIVALNKTNVLRSHADKNQLFCHATRHRGFQHEFRTNPA